MDKLTQKQSVIVRAAVRSGRLRRAPGGYVANGEYAMVHHGRTVMLLARDGWLREDGFDYVPTALAKTHFPAQGAAA